MKRICRILFAMIPILLLIFVAVVVVSTDDVTIWRAFSVIMPCVGVCFWGGVIMLIVNYIRSRK